jgi:hypothetical protein
VDEAVEVIGRAKDQADGVARSILELAEQANAVGDITTLIDDLAEQTNVLAPASRTPSAARTNAVAHSSLLRISAKKGLFVR